METAKKITKKGTDKPLNELEEKVVNSEKDLSKNLEKEDKGNVEQKIDETNGESLKKEQSKNEENIKKKEDAEKQKKEAIKRIKSEAVVNVYNVPISTKISAAICRFIKGKKISQAILDLESVIKQKKPVPMKGEIPHRHGKKIMSGRFPKSASKEFIKILKSLAANASYYNIDEPVIVEAISNKGSRPYGRFGRIRRKRTNIKIIAKNEKKNEKNKSK